MSKKNNEQKQTEFIPTPKQIAYLQALVDPDVPWTISGTCKAAGVNRGSYYEWLKDENFCKWMKEQHDKIMAKMIPHLAKVAWKMAPKDFRYFEFLQRKFGGVQTPVEAGAKMFGESMWDAVLRYRQGEERKEDGDD